jgi:hypothetical protein
MRKPDAEGSMTVQGTVNSGVIVLDQPAPWPEGTRVEILLKVVETQEPDRKPTLSQRLLKHAGTVPDLPSDMAEQHDHYIHKTPKR